MYKYSNDTQGIPKNGRYIPKSTSTLRYSNRQNKDWNKPSPVHITTQPQRQTSWNNTSQWASSSGWKGPQHSTTQSARTSVNTQDKRLKTFSQRSWGQSARVSAPKWGHTSTVSAPKWGQSTTTQSSRISLKSHGFGQTPSKGPWGQPFPKIGQSTQWGQTSKNRWSAKHRR